MRPTRPLLFTASICAVLMASSGAALAQQEASSTASSTSTQPNNSGINKRDRSSETTKPIDQPNDKADIKVAAAVRRAIVKDKSLSMSAHNIKLEAINGAVTLRGPVKNDQEKAKVEADAKGVSGVTTVDNQLDIKHR